MSSGRFVDVAALHKLRGVTFNLRQVVEGTGAGLHRSPLRGASIEFAEHKPYTPGDDLRRIDWKAYAKSDRYYLREYDDETELCAYLLLDCSASMAYGKPTSKFDYARTIVGSLSYLLGSQRDRVALLGLSDTVEILTPPLSQSSQGGAVLRTLDAVKTGGGSDWSGLAHRTADLLRRRGLAMLVTDGFCPDWSHITLLRRLRGRGQWVVMLHLLHPDELRLPFEGVTRFEAMESSRSVVVDPRSVRPAYLARVEAFLAESRQRCQASRIHYVPATTEDPVERVLLSLIRPMGTVSP